MNYREFIQNKSLRVQPSGFEPESLSDHLFDYQKDVVRWALNKGRSAVFADTGLGKTIMQLEWANQVASFYGPVLILAPLAVAEQTVREGLKFGINATVSRDGSVYPITVTNYEMLSHFDPSDFFGVVVDESSILKSFTGSIRNQIIGAFSNTPFRLACTATPAPNDHTELGNHSEFLGLKSRTEMLSEFFVHDGGSTQNWRLKRHAFDDFWAWVTDWASIVRRPSDLGYSDDGFILNPLDMRWVEIEISDQDAWSEGFLFAPQSETLSDQRATRRATMTKRVEAAAEIANGTNDPVLIWCELNDESDAVTDLIPDAVSVSGSDSVDEKVDRMTGFSEGRYRVLVTKPKIAGFGMNWQHCNKMVFLGSSHSYEQTYQAIRRCWRFGQKKTVEVSIMVAATEQAIIQNYKKKEASHRAMIDGMARFMGASSHRDVENKKSEWIGYEPSQNLSLPEWI